MKKKQPSTKKQFKSIENDVNSSVFVNIFEIFLFIILTTQKHNTKLFIVYQ